jgi:hypothetical protein
MIMGSNTLFEHEGRKFHLQAEDLGSPPAAFEVRVYDGGTVLWQKRFSYVELAEQKLSAQERETALRTRMEKTLLTVEAAIAKGKIP